MMRQIRRQLKFVRLLHQGGTISRCGTLVRCASTTQHVTLEPQMVAALISQGVLAGQGNHLTTTRDAASWMRRQRLLLADPTPTAATAHTSARAKRELPIVGNGQLNRLYKTEKGRQGLLSADHILAANRLERLIERAMLTPKITRDYSQLAGTLGHSRGKGTADISDMAAEARKELAKLYQQLPPDCINALVDICGFSKGLQEIEASRNWPRRSAKLVVKIGLDQLGAIWGIGELTRPGRAPQGKPG